MSGHSKWSSIKHRKGAADARRGQLFTKLARAIQVAARDGGGDPAGNAALATAVQKAKDARMPKDNIERAIAKGSGAGGQGDAIEAVAYEGYGPGGVAVLVEALTDNRNRTGADVRAIFSKNGGSSAEPGAVAWQFERKATIIVPKEGPAADEDELMMIGLDAGMEDLQDQGDTWQLTAPPTELGRLRDALEAAGVKAVSAELTMEPTSTIAL